MTIKFSFRGLMAPVFTPFDKYGNINYSIIQPYAKYLHDSQIEGILVNGTTGEGVSLTQQERKDVLEVWLKESQTYDLTVMAQIGGTNLKEVKSLASYADHMGVSAILCLPDLFFKPSNINDLVDYLKIVSKEAPNTPLLYYHIPDFTGINLDMRQLLERSSEVPTFVGIKFTDCHLEMVASLVGKTNDPVVFLGSDSHLLSALNMGFDSAIGTTINIFPHTNRNILRYYKSYDMGDALREQLILNHNIQEITKHGSWVSSMKGAMRILTPIDVGPVRQPLKNVTMRVDDLDLQSSP